MTNIGYAPDGLSFQTKVVAEVDPTVSPEATKALNVTNERVSKILGFDRNIVGEKFNSNNDEFTVTALKPERPKWPIVALKTGTTSHFKFQATKHIRWVNKDITYKYDF